MHAYDGHDYLSFGAATGYVPYAGPPFTDMTLQVWLNHKIMCLGELLTTQID